MKLDRRWWVIAVLVLAGVVVVKLGEPKVAAEPGEPMPASLEEPVQALVAARP